MPTYQYACTNSECGNRFELVQSFTDPAASECPVCGSAVRKVYGSVGVVFKGSGFYRNDSRSQNGSAVSAESSKDSGGKDSSSKDSGSKDSGSKDSGSKDSGSKESKGSGDSSAASSSSSSSGKDSGSSSAASSSSGSSGKAASPA